MTNTIFAFYFFLQEEVSGAIIAAPAQTGFEETVINLVSWLKLGIEIIGAVIIFIGIICAIYQLFKTLSNSEEDGFTKIRLLLARYLVLALEFQLAADILSTAIAPTWDRIGKLAAIAVIRTVLNYFLTREMKEERELIDMENTVINEDKDESKI